MINRMRIILCQLEFHPSFCIDRLATLEEPFKPEKMEDSLSYLGNFGLSLGTLQEICKNKNKQGFYAWK